MKYIGMTLGMWVWFEKSFEKQLTNVMGYDPNLAKGITSKAKFEYRKILDKLPDFEKGDRFQMNIVSCAMFSAFLLAMPTLPSVEKAIAFYREAMMTKPMHWFCRQSGKKKFTKSDIEGLRKVESFRAADRNPYSWNMELHEYTDGSGYEARFTKCGICTLMNELGLHDLIPAMCRLDYTMSEAGGTTEFVREYTLASGGPYCDCGYKRKS
ncbi:MAG: L-2-amino-thiazoline-4-carboxylic acid hydrolase [Oscillospiraceae bacterium]|nr:L-2-amino-thiazoline-4-carboxylic acid hydrolase [Oscillospiraceae bacterium]